MEGDFESEECCDKLTIEEGSETKREYAGEYTGYYTRTTYSSSGGTLT